MTMIDFNQNIMYVVTASDLKEFAMNLLEEYASHTADAVNAEVEEYLTPDETSALMHVNKSTLWRWAQSGYLVPVKCGGRRTLYRKSDCCTILKGGNL